jgi:hypothetical protein
MSTEIIIAYTATSISILGRLVFMSLLYSKKSTNIYSLLFCIMNIVSSSLWIEYSQLASDTPVFVRSSSDLLLFVISASYISYNRYNQTTNYQVIEIENNFEIKEIEFNK